MTWPNGVRQPKRYANCEESYQDFYRIWKKYYKKFPDEHLAKKWSGNDRHIAWLKNTTAVYERF